MIEVIPPVEIHDFDLRPVEGPPFESGGQAELFWKAIPSGEVMVFKRYRPNVLLPNGQERLTEMAEFRWRMPRAIRWELDQRVAWIRYVVVSRSGETVGVLVPPAPQEFWWVNKRNEIRPRHISELQPQPDRALKLSKDHFALPQVVARLGHLLSSMRFLHQHNIVIADVHGGNTLISGLGTKPRTFLVDSDAMILDGRPALVRAALPKLWSSDMPPWPDPFDTSCDLAFFAHMAVGLIGKDLSIIAVTPDVRSNLLTSHGNLLDFYLHRRDLHASAVELGAVAAIWQTYVSEEQEEYIRRGESGSRYEWPGPHSFLAPHSAQSSALISLPSALPRIGATAVARDTKINRPVPSKPSAGRLQTSSSKQQAKNLLMRRQSRLNRKLAKRLGAAILLVALTGGFTAIALDVFRPLSPSPAGLSPEKVAVGNDNLANVMNSFPNTRQKPAGTLSVNLGGPVRQHGAVTETVTITGFKSVLDQSLQLKYFCAGPTTKTAHLAAGPYLLVGGISTVVSTRLVAMPTWKFNPTSTPSGQFTLYTPVCTFLDGVAVTPPPTLNIPARGELKPSLGYATKIVFAVTPDGKSGPVTDYPYTAYAFVWVTPGGQYLFAGLPN